MSHMKRITLVFTMIVGLELAAPAADRPNILWLTCEDISPHLRCYNDPHAITPHLDQLAKEGVKFSNVYAAAGVCAPNRSTIITGMHQNSIGTHHMRCKAKLPSWLKPFSALPAKRRLLLHKQLEDRLPVRASVSQSSLGRQFLQGTLAKPQQWPAILCCV